MSVRRLCALFQCTVSERALEGERKHPAGSRIMPRAALSAHIYWPSDSASSSSEDKTIRCIGTPIILCARACVLAARCEMINVLNDANFPI